MDKPAWRESALEGRLLKMTLLSGECELRTSIGTRYPVFARVEVCSGLFAGQVYESVPVFSPPLKAQLLEKGLVEGRLGKGARLEGAGVQWVLKETAGRG